MSTERRAVIIGAGLGGLATALHLSGSGWQVTVVERSGSPGGKMNRWQARGYTFDTGPSLITWPQVFEELFLSAGARLEDHVQLMRLDPVARYVFSDSSELLAGSSLPRWETELGRGREDDHSGFYRLLALGGQLFELSRQTFFAAAPQEPPRREMLSALRRMPLRHGWGNYHGTVARFLRSEKLVRYFDRYATYVGSSPYKAPATLLAIPYLEFAYGAHYIVGGLYRLVLALESLLLDRGIDIRLNCEARIIHHKRRTVEAVELADGSVLPAEVAVFNGDAAVLPQLLGQTEPAADERSLSGCVILLGIRRRLENHHHHTVYFSNDYRREFDQLFGTPGRAAVFPDDPTVYVNIPTRSDTSLAPAGCEAVFIMANCPASAEWGAEDTARARAKIMQRLAASGFPDLTPDIEVEQIWSPQQFAQRYAMPGGALYGQASHGWRGTFFRPAIRERHVRGLFRVGGSSHPGGGTPTVLLSARIAAELVNRYER